MVHIGVYLQAEDHYCWITALSELLLPPLLIPNVPMSQLPVPVDISMPVANPNPSLVGPNPGVQIPQIGNEVLESPPEYLA